MRVFMWDGLIVDSDDEKVKKDGEIVKSNRKTVNSDDQTVKSDSYTLQSDGQPKEGSTQSLSNILLKKFDTQKVIQKEIELLLRQLSETDAISRK